MFCNGSTATVFLPAADPPARCLKNQVPTDASTVTTARVLSCTAVLATCSESSSSVPDPFQPSGGSAPLIELGTNAAVVVLFCLLLIVAVFANYFRLWIQSFLTGAGITIWDLIGMTFRQVNKDVIVKSKIMAGFDAPYVPGWDCHGLPIEFKVDQELGKRKATMSVAEIRAECMATGVELDQSSGRVTGVRYIHDGSEQFQRADAVAVAGYSIETPRLLLASDAGSYMTGGVIAVDGGHLVSGL